MAQRRIWKETKNIFCPRGAGNIYTLGHPRSEDRNESDHRGKGEGR
jgi:hypothetical protein